MSFANRQSRRKSYNISGHAHELTFSCYRRYPFLKAERCCAWLAEAINDARERLNFALWGYVFMPDHVHLIIFPRGDQYAISRILESIKRPVGVQAIRYLEATNSSWLARLTRRRGQRTERLFWQSGGGYDRNITSPKTLLRMLDYLHENPVRKGLVTRAQDWLWSSAGYFLGGSSPLVIDAIPPEWLQVDA
jgi:putative transposase